MVVQVIHEYLDGGTKQINGRGNDHAVEIESSWESRNEELEEVRLDEKEFVDIMINQGLAEEVMAGEKAKLRTELTVPNKIMTINNLNRRNYQPDRKRKVEAKVMESILSEAAQVGRRDPNFEVANFYTKARIHLNNDKYEINHVLIDAGSVINLAPISVLGSGSTKLLGIIEGRDQNIPQEVVMIEKCQNLRVLMNPAVVTLDIDHELVEELELENALEDYESRTKDLDSNYREREERVVHWLDDSSADNEESKMNEEKEEDGTFIKADVYFNCMTWEWVMEKLGKARSRVVAPEEL
ncbi:hypothetical protein L873DRAFT_1845855 [Choiromyces venosus 120613-1]|uniref:Uncharacterized protein n=1 Tax=Choiromyces venosus 120613-1 TaxID=1336337 RepID=A0A3N4JBK9_9PEZI|nr:hypothetical protein L873DRAFT_1845855 [Choiromyces venosus 120613-1]